MTKRFTLIQCPNGQWGIIDTSQYITDQLILTSSNKKGTKYLVNELNKLQEENIKQERVLTKLIPAIALCNKYKIPIEDLAPTLEEYIERDQE